MSRTALSVSMEQISRGSAMSGTDREADENSHDRVIARRVIFRRNALFRFLGLPLK